LYSQSLLQQQLCRLSLAFCHGWHLSWLQRRWNVRDQYGGRGRAVRLYSVISSRVFKFFCGRALSCWRRISVTFLWDQSLLKRLLVFRMTRSELVGLIAWHNAYQNRPSCQKTEPWLFPVEGVTLNVFT
jgi:hypothetical protein